MIRKLSRCERLAALAGLAAAIASLVGFVPGLYRDPAVVVAQSHGYDVGNLIAVVLLGWGLARGTLAGRLVAIGALGSLLYGYVTYAFLIVLNPATILYIAVLGLGGWAFATGLAARDIGTEHGDRLPRRTTAGLFIVVTLLFAANWLGQIAKTVVKGHLPTELSDIGWPMNPVYVLDLAFVLPLTAYSAVRLLTRRPDAARTAVPLLVFMSLLGLTILTMTAWSAADGQTLDPVLPAIFVPIVLAATALARLGLSAPRTSPDDQVRVRT